MSHAQECSEESLQDSFVVMCSLQARKENNAVRVTKAHHISSLPSGL